MKEFIIGEVLDVTTMQRSRSFGYRVGRTCLISLDTLAEGSPLVVWYNECNYFSTTRIVELEQTDYGMWITTENRKYRFDEVGAEIDTSPLPQF